ncbi:hypothetical protein HDF24_18420 [Mucilaginibacter sp. X4EP1]|uniref:hypothetical protein n=1 Tax=Mucilaginibacter sp. X4EP1 TaxID=2723092 RepID=UPI002168A0D4|nr:hypothetical protein [Mucilaginibacter sp. X4EP1]MCS3813453.1 hypothetical protein [Mucilaginibacter sp. X4EP1]
MAGNAQQMDRYFQRIRNNPAKLTAFFIQMPKGGDLHHHYSGSVYAESYIKWVVERNYFINTKTLEVAEKAPNADPAWKSFSELIKCKQLDSIKYALLIEWSIKDYKSVKSECEEKVQRLEAKLSEVISVQKRFVNIEPIVTNAVAQLAVIDAIYYKSITYEKIESIGSIYPEKFTFEDLQHRTAKTSDLYSLLD